MRWREWESTDGDRLVRPWQPEDDARIGTSPRDPEIGTYFGRAVNAPDVPSDDPDAFTFAVVEGDKVLARIWCRPGIRPFEIGYFVKREAWGRGLATHGLRSVSRWLLTDGDEPEVALCIHPENDRSIRVAERAGFRLAGDVEQYAHFKDGTTRALRYVLSAADLQRV